MIKTAVNITETKKNTEQLYINIYLVEERLIKYYVETIELVTDCNFIELSIET
jgi:hypothetical protein